MVALQQMPLRIPKDLHRDIRAEAKKRGMSLNQYCLFLLARHTPKAKEKLSQRGEDLLQFIEQARVLQEKLNPTLSAKPKPIFSLKRRLKKIHEKN